MRKLLTIVVLLFALAATSCEGDVAIGQVARCDGVLQGTEVTVDDLFDADADGWFDGNNPDCVEAVDGTTAENDWEAGAVCPVCDTGLGPSGIEACDDPSLNQES